MFENHYKITELRKLIFWSNFQNSVDITHLNRKRKKKRTHPFDVWLFLHYQFCKTTLRERYQHNQKDILDQICCMPNCSFDHHGNGHGFQLWAYPVKKSGLRSELPTFWICEYAKQVDTLDKKDWMDICKWFLPLISDEVFSSFCDLTKESVLLTWEFCHDFGCCCGVQCVLERERKQNYYLD